MDTRTVDEEITLIPFYPDPETTLKWYQDPELCLLVDNRDHVYDLDMLNRMYDFLSSNGECYYIQYRGTLVGDISLLDSGEICIVICREYQGLKIGSRSLRNILSLAEEKGLPEVKARIFPFNTVSRMMFESAGFRRISEEWFTCEIPVDDQII